MPVTFVFGRAGSGKTFRCFTSIVDELRARPLGPPIYWLLPKQATFDAERQLTCASGLGGFCRARVVSFDQLARDVFDDCGGSSIPRVTALGRQMILGHLLRQLQPRLRFFGGVARQAGLARELDTTFAEFERSGKGAADIESLVHEFSPARSSDVETHALGAKLHDLHLLYSTYVSYLGQDRLDQHRWLSQVLECLPRCGFLRQSTVYVDGFRDFTEFERRILAGVAKAAVRMEITLLLDPDLPPAPPEPGMENFSLFRRTEETYHRLSNALAEAQVSVLPSVHLRKIHRFQTTATRYLETAMFDDHALAKRSTTDVEFIEAPDVRAEADGVARGIRKLLSRELRLRDIAVLVRHLNAHHALLRASLEEHGIPHFVDVRRTAAHHPLLQFIRSALQIARVNWPHDAVMAILKTGLAGLTPDDSDRVENYVLQHRIRGAGWESPEPWAFETTLLRQGEDDTAATHHRPADIDALRRSFVNRLGPLIELLRHPASPTVRQIAAELFATLERFGVRAELDQWIESANAALRREDGAEHQQVWAELVEMFEQMVDLLGDEPLTAAEFSDVLESGFDSFDLALTPPTLDQVLVGQVDRTRTAQVKAVFVMGLNDGEFPATAHDTSLVSGRERFELEKRRLQLDPDAGQRQLDERLLGYIAFTRGTERLTVSRSRTDADGQPAAPSVFWQRLKTLLPDAPHDNAEAEADLGIEHLSTPRQLVTALMRWVREQRPAAGTPNAATADPASPWPALYDWLARHECQDDAIDIIRFRSWRALAYTNGARLTPATSARLFQAPLMASASQLETFAECPFRHFLRFGLGLRERERADVTPNDLGHLYHRLLEQLIGGALRACSGRTLADLDVDEQTLRACAQEAGRALRGELMLGSARNRYLLDRIEKTLARFLAAQREIMKRGQFRPALAAVTFGLGGRLPPLAVKTPRGADVLVHGKIDRVDVIDADGRFSVIDYKLRSHSLSISEVYHGVSLQLLTYLLIIQDAAGELAGRPLTPTAAFYMGLLRKLEDVDHPGEACDPSDPLFHLKEQPRGILDSDALAAFDSDCERGKSQVVSAFIKKDGQLGRMSSSDVVSPAQFSGILDAVRSRLGKLAEQILEGTVDVAPYRLGKKTPCPRCEYRSVCRFDPASDRYRSLEPLGRQDALRRMTENDGGST